MIGLAEFVLIVSAVVSVGYDLRWHTRLRKWLIDA